MNIQTQISRIQMILGHPAMKTCLDCGKVYLPMNKITLHLCPFCQTEEIKEIEAGEFKIDSEEVSIENEDLPLFDDYKGSSYHLHAKKANEKAKIARQIKRK